MASNKPCHCFAHRGRASGLQEGQILKIATVATAERD